MNRRWVQGLVLAGCLAVPAAGPAAELTVSAAVSLKEGMEELGRRFRAAHPGVTLYLNFGSSGALEQQIAAGAPVDLFVSAADRHMDALERRGLVLAPTRRVFARNLLVVVKPADSRVDLAAPADLLTAAVGRVVIGNPRTVPAGQYAEESLRALGLWDPLRPKLVLAEHVRQALEYVARGEVDAGFVYATDAAVRRREVIEAFRPPEDSYRPIAYPAALVTGTAQPTLARAFLDLLVSREGQAVLARFGFRPSAPGG